MEFKTDIEIAQPTPMRPITEIAKVAGVDEKYLELYGNYKAKTSHTLNPVPCYIYDNFYGDSYTFNEGDFGLANVAATVVTMMGYDAPEMWEKSLINLK